MRMRKTKQRRKIHLRSHADWHKNTSLDLFTTAKEFVKMTELLSKLLKEHNPMNASLK